MTTGRDLALAMPEAHLQHLCLGLAAGLRMLGYHTHDSRRSQPGFPDIVAVGRRGVLFRELKKETVRVTKHQERWLKALVLAGVDPYVRDPAQWALMVYRPSDWLSGRVEREFKGIA